MKENERPLIAVEMCPCQQQGLGCMKLFCFVPIYAGYFLVGTF